MDVSEAVRAEIKRKGAISFASFMELALYGKGGFYEQPPIGSDAHFITSPHVHPIFGHLLGVAIEGLWVVTGERAPLRLLEAGAGDGTLARQILDTLSELPVEYAVTERSPVARRMLTEMGLIVHESLDEIGPFVGTVIANELLDNLLFRRVRGTPNGAVEVLVGSSDGAFVEVEAPCPKELAVLCPDLYAGEEALISLESIAFIDRLSKIILDGYVILIDYGDESSGDVHGYRAQRIVEDVLDSPGTADITAGVNFRAVADHAARLGFKVFGPISQQLTLRRLGFTEWEESQRARQVSLLADGSGPDAVKTWGSRNEASMLVDPAKLGAMQWLVLATPGVPMPPWMAPGDRV